ncbi:MAG: hypothetical protein PF495_08150 [Spirochaetales bacterium]|jgi:hypothetical protein|nr:hypothetical protein [Spirochaetales bacterium]
MRKKLQKRNLQKGKNSGIGCFGRDWHVYFLLMPICVFFCMLVFLSGCRINSDHQLQPVVIKAYPPLSNESGVRLSADRSAEAGSAVLPDEYEDVLMNAYFYVLIAQNNVEPFVDTSGNNLEIVLNYDKEQSCWTGEMASDIAAAADAVNQNMLVLIRNGERDDKTLFYGMEEADAGKQKEITVQVLNGYQLGDVGPAGGYIYHEQSDKAFLQSRWRYLEAAQNRWSGPDAVSDPAVFWGAANGVAGAGVDGVGLGLEQTQLICLNTGDGSEHAAGMCAAAEINGFSDWFLPTAGEMELLMSRVGQDSDPSVTLESGEGKAYWSSSEAEVSKAKALIYSESGVSEPIGLSKNLSLLIRPSRRF